MKKILNLLRRLNIRDAIISMLSIVMARTGFLSMNPIAVAYFAATYSQKKYRRLLICCTLLGLGLSLELPMFIKYGSIILLMSAVSYFAERQGRALTLLPISLLAGLTTTVLSIVQGAFHIGTGALAVGNGVFNIDRRLIILSVLEGVLIVAIANLFYLAIDFVRHAKKGQQLSNQEMISVALLGGCLVYGIPVLKIYQFSVIETIVYLLIIIMGYKYGAGAGSVTGTVCSVVLCLQGYDIKLIAVLCILGITAGMFRELGRFTTGIVFIVVNVFLCNFLMPDLLTVGPVRALVSAVILFIGTPKQFMGKADLFTVEARSNFEEMQVQNLTRERLRDFSDSFQKLAKSFYSLAQKRANLEKSDVDMIFDNVSDNICKKCKNCTQCWEKNFYNTQQTAASILEAAKQQGYVKAEDLPDAFSKRCIHFERFLNETNRELAFATLNMNWSNRMVESRMAIAGQLGEVAMIIDQFSDSLNQTREVSVEDEEIIRKCLIENQLDVKKITMLERENRRKQVYITLRTRKTRCITAKEVAAMVSKVTGTKLKPSIESKSVITREYERICFVEEAGFQTITGAAKLSKTGETVSGDTFSIMNLEHGETIMILSDGMGVGESANEESEVVISLLEQFLEAGFTEQSAIKLINSILVLNSDYETVSTLDISSINLYTGVCNFVKIGASTTFVKRNGWIETIQSTNMPVGMFTEVDIEDSAKKLYDGDYVIMVSDGVLDCLEGLEKEEEFKDILLEIDVANPQELATSIIERVKERNREKVRDDMTVLVAGFWEKT